MALAIAGTVRVLRAASRKLPPLVGGLVVPDQPVSGGSSFTASFRLVDNNSRSLSYDVRLVRDGVVLATLASGTVQCTRDRSNGMCTASLSLQLRIPDHVTSGGCSIDVRAIDQDGNETPDDVNHDECDDNDTIRPLTFTIF